MAHTLSDLIKASGNAGTSGQSFRNHVLGAASGALMRDYLVDLWEHWDSPDYIEGASYPNNQLLNFVFDMVAGTRFHYIRDHNAPTPASLSIVHNGIDGLSVETVAGAGSAWDTFAQYIENIVRVKLVGKTYLLGAVVTGVSYNWFPEYIPESPDFPAHFNPTTWRIGVSVNNEVPPGTYDEVEFYFVYEDEFNLPLQSPTFTVRVGKNGVVDEIEYEWALDSSFTNIIKAGPDNFVEFLTPDPDTSANSGYVYLRYRRVNGSGAWSYFPVGNTGIYWEDPRFNSWPPFNTP